MKDCDCCKSIEISSLTDEEIIQEIHKRIVDGKIGVLERKWEKYLDKLKK